MFLKLNIIEMKINLTIYIYMPEYIVQMFHTIISKCLDFNIIKHIHYCLPKYKISN